MTNLNYCSIDMQIFFLIFQTDIKNLLYTRLHHKVHSSFTDYTLFLSNKAQLAHNVTVMKSVESKREREREKEKVREKERGRERAIHSQQSVLKEEIDYTGILTWVHHYLLELLHMQCFHFVSCSKAWSLSQDEPERLVHLAAVRTAFC